MSKENKQVKKGEKWRKTFQKEHDSKEEPSFIGGADFNPNIEEDKKGIFYNNKVKWHCKKCDRTSDKIIFTYCPFCEESTPQEPIEWESEFEEMVHAKGQFIVSSRVVKQFIQNQIKQALASQKKELMEKIKEKLKCHYAECELPDEGISSRKYFYHLGKKELDNLLQDLIKEN